MPVQTGAELGESFQPIFAPLAKMEVPWLGKDPCCQERDT